MRILLSGPPPWANSGYGIQVDLTAGALIQLGHQVGISAYAGVHEERDWNGAQILSTGGKGYGAGVIAGNYRRWEADLLITISDCFMIDPRQLAGLHLMPWVPIDTHKIGHMDKTWLAALADTAASLRPVAMSLHGQQLLKAAGWDAPYVPHAVHPMLYPDPGAGRNWRAQLGIDPEAFLIAKVGVNNDDDRKSFEVTLLAFADHAGHYPRSRLYLHTEPQVPKAPNLAVMALDLGLKGKVIFAGEHERSADLLGVGYMRGLYNGADVLDAATKGEGCGVPPIEALMCGTPVIACRNSAMTEKIRPEYGWLIGGQRTWARHHQAWWVQPSAAQLTRAYAQASASARSMHRAASMGALDYSPGQMKDHWRLALESPARPADHAKIFRSAYQSGQWGHGSGPGSDPAACRPYISYVENYLIQHRIGSVLDLGCGDGQLARAIDWAEAAYEGLDVVTGSDMRTCLLPDADLVLVKDVFQHWTLADIEAMLTRLRGFRHVLVTNTISEDITGRPVNAEISPGQWRAIDLRQHPFRWDALEVLRWDLPGETKQTVELTAAASAPDRP